MASDEHLQPAPPGNSSPDHQGMAQALTDQLSQVEPATRKRPHGEIDDEMNGRMGDEQPAPNYRVHSREGSASSHFVPSGDENTTRTRTIKRPDAPVNQQGKYVCQYAPECHALTFDRKCEWSKHMDKHDRPYRCQHAECAKLQGFTYSGGLLRHEREVHNKHGGPKATLVCPHPDCKRHTGKGFTRKENLNEHVRRVHESKDGATQSQSQSIKQPDDMSQAINGAGDVDAPYYHETADSPMRKRRRYTQGTTSERSATEDAEDLRQEVDRLRQEAQMKDAQMVDMQRQLEDLRHRLNQYAPPPQPTESV